MKKITLPLLCIVLTIQYALGQSAPPIAWDTTVHDFGVIRKGNPNHFRFAFKNLSDRPLLLDNVRTNCKCILPYWNNKPIMPNEEGEIFIVLTVQKSGIFKKGVLVSFNGYKQANQLEVWGYTDDVDDLIVQKSVTEVKTDVPNGDIGNHQPKKDSDSEISDDVPGDPFRKSDKPEELPDIYSQENEKPTEEAYSFMSKRESNMIQEINLLRTNPKGYILFIEDYIGAMQNEIDVGVSSKEQRFYKTEIKTAQELITELEQTKPLSKLEPHKGVYEAAKGHGLDMIKNKYFDHIGTDGSKPWERIMENAPELTDANENLVGGPYDIRQAVIILLVDTGIRERGHRKTLLNPDWSYVACYEIGSINTLENCWIQNFGK